MEFNNNSSQCMFVGNRSLQEVITQDERELAEIGGSFEAIADRMDLLTKTAEKSRPFPHDFDDKVTIVSYVATRGIQECPFDRTCQIWGYIGWNEFVKIKSKKTGRQLTINSGTAHLARVHRLLEKDNEYGISAREFYESFM